MTLPSKVIGGRQVSWTEVLPWLLVWVTALYTHQEAYMLHNLEDRLAIDHYIRKIEAVEQLGQSGIRFFESAQIPVQVGFILSHNEESCKDDDVLPSSS